MLIIALAMVAIIFINNNSVYATAEEKIEENEVKKVVKYDVATDKTIEVNLEMINNLLRSSNSNEMAYSTESYTPEIINKKSEYVPRIIGYNSLESYNIYNNYYNRLSGYDEEYVDNRFFIRETSKSPYVKICQIECDGGHATGVLVGDRYLLTAAHNIFDKDNNNERYTNWVCKPGYFVGTYYGDICGYSGVYYMKNWLDIPKDKDNHDDDWAICELEKPLGEMVGYMGITYYPNSRSLENMEVSVVGYPSDTGTEHLVPYQSDGRIYSDKIDTNSFEYTSYTTPGFSGGPVFGRESQQVVGVHNGGVLDKDGVTQIAAHASRINSYIYDTLTMLKSSQSN